MAKRNIKCVLKKLPGPNDASMHRLGLFGVPRVDMLRWQRMGEVADGGVMVGVASSLLPEGG